MNVAKPFWILIIAFFLLMIGPYLLSHGMFMDGIMYATISNNLANGIGSWNDLAFTETIAAHFKGHPPLAFWIQSLFYKVFGDSYLIEKFYSALTYALTGFFMVKTWNLVSKFKKLAWLPIIVWLSIPIITQAARNNLLENTMMVFTTIALFYIVKFFQCKNYSNLIIAGICLFLAFLTKGPVSFFIWSMPFWWFVFFPKIKFNLFIKSTIILIIATIVPLLILLIVSNDIKMYLSEYYHHQILNSLQHKETVGSRFWILQKLLKELITPGIIIAIILITRSYHKSKLDKIEFSPWLKLLLLSGISGVIPMIISLKQNGFYFIPALPFFAIAIALFIAPIIYQSYLTIEPSHKIYKLFYFISVIALSTSFVIIFYNNGKNGRDDGKLQDLKKIHTTIGKHTKIHSSIAIKKDWTTLAYLFRYYQVSVINDGNFQSNYYLDEFSNSSKIEGYTPIELNLTQFRLYEKNK